MIEQQRSLPTEPQTSVDGSLRKRVCKACDRCRLKKSKCDGSTVCSRCRLDNAICVFGERKKTHDKVYPKGYVEMLEQQQAQLVAGLQELYRRTQNGQGWEGPPLKESSHGTPLTHDILEGLGALRPTRHNGEAEHFEEDLSSLQRRLLANGAGWLQRTSSDTSSDADLSPTFSQGSRKPQPMDPFSFSKLPPTPPTYSPFPQHASPTLSVDSPSEDQSPSLQKVADESLQQNQVWASSNMVIDTTDALRQFESPIHFDAMPSLLHTSAIPNGTIAPCLSMRDWDHDVDFHRYFTAAMMY